MNKKILFALLALALASFACSQMNNTLAATFDPCNLSFVSPATGLKYHEDNVQIMPVIKSSCDRQQLGIVSLDDVQLYPCLIEGNTNSTCQAISLTEPGVHKISVSIDDNGKRENFQTMIEWSPYTDLDKMVALGGDPTKGYILWSLVLIIIFTLAITLITKGSGVGAFVGFFTSLLIIDGIYLLAGTPGPALAVFVGTIVLAIVSLVVAVLMHGINKGNAVARVEKETITIDSKGNPERTKIKATFAGPGKYSPTTKQQGNPTRQITDRGGAGLLDLVTEHDEVDE